MPTIQYAIDDRVLINGAVFVNRKPEDHVDKPFLFTPKLHLLQYFIEADRHVMIRGKEKHIGDGYMMFSCANEPYTSYRHLKTTKAINIQFTTHHMREHIVDRRLASALERNIHLPFIYDMNGHSTIYYMFNELLYLSSSHDDMNMLKAEVILKQILIEIAGFYKKGAVKHQQGLLYSIECLERNYHMNYKIDTLADMANMSRSAYIKAFKRQTGSSVASYAMKVKIGIAAMLLTTEPSMKVKDIAEQLGFCDAFYFSSTFKKHTGKSPKAYRN